MTHPGVSRGGMTALELDELTLDRLVAGLVDADDAPVGYQRVAVLIAAATGAPTHDEVTPPPNLADLVTSSPMPVPPTPVARRRSGRIAVATAGLLLAVTGTAAASNQLPPAVQRAVADMAGQLGIQVPEPAADAPTPATGGPERSLPGPSGEGVEPTDHPTRPGPPAVSSEAPPLSQAGPTGADQTETPPPTTTPAGEMSPGPPASIAPGPNPPTSPAPRPPESAPTAAAAQPGGPSVPSVDGPALRPDAGAEQIAATVGAAQLAGPRRAGR